MSSIQDLDGKDRRDLLRALNAEIYDHEEPSSDDWTLVNLAYRLGQIRAGRRIAEQVQELVRGQLSLYLRVGEE